MTTAQNLLHLSHIAGFWTTPVTPRPWPDELESILPVSMMRYAQQQIATWPDYSPTSLHSLPAVAASAGVAHVYYKDESTRFGLGSFKALGGAYAVLFSLSEQLSISEGKSVSMSEVRKGLFAEAAGQITVTTATDGNHGRSVAWGARMAGCRCRIYIHREVSSARADAMQALGADVIRTDGDYDASVHQCARDADKNGWQVISDTSYTGYQDVPRLVMAGYTAMVGEITQQLSAPPTHVFIQAGVGGLAAAVSAAMWSIWEERMPRIIIVESEHANCVLRSMQSGQPAAIPIKQETIMAGLSCGEISLIAWEILSRCVTAVLTLSDDAVKPAMRMLANGNACGAPIEAGECAVPGIIGLLAATKSAPLNKHLQLDHASAVLVFGTEGATDPALYRQIITDAECDTGA